MSEWLIKQNNTSIQDVLVKDKDGNPVTNLDSTEYIKFQVKEKRDDTTPKISKTKGDGITVLTGDDLGKLRLTILPSDTANVESKSYKMGLEIKWSDTLIYEINLTVNGKETEIFRVYQDIVQ